MAEFLDADQAAEFLGVKRETLYAYASRGELESVTADEDGRRAMYRKTDLERLKRRSRARAGHAAAATTALDWGPASLETEIGAITPRGPVYRGERLSDLAGAESFESVADRLWEARSRGSSGWPSADREILEAERPSAREGHVVEYLLSTMNRLRVSDLNKYSNNRRELVERGRRILRTAAAAGGAALEGSAPLERRIDADHTAEAVAKSLGVAGVDGAIPLVERTLVVCAEHGLNTSSFAARVAASTGADLYASLLAAMSAFSGPQHGLSSERVRSFVRTVSAPQRAEEALLGRLRRGDSVPGFGHPLYEHGDPRYAMLRESVAGEDRGERLAVLDAVVEAADAAGLPAPNLDVGVAAVAEALDTPTGAGPFLFAVGRMAGWIAHAIEQGDRDEILRPRAEYTRSGGGS